MSCPPPPPCPLKSALFGAFFFFALPAINDPLPAKLKFRENTVPVECKIVLWGFGSLLSCKLYDFSIIDVAGLFSQMQYGLNKILNKT